MSTALQRDSGLGTRDSGQCTLVVGLGATGASVARHLRREGVAFAVTDSRAQPPGIDSVGEAPRALGGFASPVPLDQIGEAVISPGVSLHEPFVRELHEAGITIVGDIELFARAIARVPSPESRVPRVIGITGSNGKSTVTTLVGEMARAAGIRVAVGGNLGEPALDLLTQDAALYVLELSSFQLETTHSLRCTAATVLNLSEDHLDRHGSLENYAAAKARIYDGATTAVVNRDDAASARNAAQAGRQIRFGLDRPAAGDYGLIETDGERWLAAGATPLLPLSALKIVGLHNAANALAALALAEAAGIPRAPALAALREFAGLPHRCQWVAEIDGVTWINDSKGTNVGATLAALQGLSGPLLWIGGGQGKGQDFSPLRAPLHDKARAAIVFGEDAPLLLRVLDGAVSVRQVPDLDAAVDSARAEAQAGDRVLLSPACASFDQFKNYIARGERFVQRVLEQAA